MTALSFVYARFMHKVVRLNGEIGQTAEANMGIFRIFRPITVVARQSTKAETIATDLGFANVNPGDWVIRGEAGETYILNDEFFQRTFEPVQKRQLRQESRGSLKRISPVRNRAVLDLPGRTTRHRLRAATRRNQKVNQSL